MPAPKEITESKSLLVEGKDSVDFFLALLKHMDLKGMQVQNFGGIYELRGFLKALRNMPGFTRKVTSLGVIRDAEDNAKAAFQSVCGSLKNANLSVPEKHVQQAGQNPIVSIFILPDNKSPGMLETICLQSVHDDPVIDCIDQYFNCVTQKTGDQREVKPKARVQAFLASRTVPGLHLRTAAYKGYWPWDDPAFDDIKRFLQAL